MRPRTIVLATLPKRCELCSGRERVLISSPGANHSAVVPCLHCVWQLPIAHLAMRADR